MLLLSANIVAAPTPFSWISRKLLWRKPFSCSNHHLPQEVDDLADRDQHHTNTHVYVRTCETMNYWSSQPSPVIHHFDLVDVTEMLIAVGLLLFLCATASKHTDEQAEKPAVVTDLAIDDDVASELITPRFMNNIDFVGKVSSSLLVNKITNRRSSGLRRSQGQPSLLHGLPSSGPRSRLARDLAGHQHYLRRDHDWRRAVLRASRLRSASTSFM